MSKRLPQEFEITIEKMSPKGEGVGRFKNRAIFVYGTIIGERVLVAPVKLKRGKAFARVIKIIEKSKLRQKEKESHYLTCSPWQVLPYKEQLRYKIDLTRKLFKDEANILPRENVEIESSDNLWNYRNKMEFSFTEAGGKISLAFHVRNKYWEMYALDECCLATKKINECGNYIIDILNNENIKLEQIKNLMIRYSYHEDKCLAILYVTDEKFTDIKISNNDIKGWKIIYSDPKSPATVITKKIFNQGEDFLIEEILDLKLRYTFDSFFQINPPAFKKIIKYLKDNIKNREVLVDLYAGVGTIGLCLKDNFAKIISVESIDNAVKQAKQNIVDNKVKNVEIYSGLSEKQDLEYFFKKADTLIIDPPRSGLHPKVVQKIVKFGPSDFIYVSCNPQTQAKDLNVLKEKYEVIDWKLFDMYPQTPHVESVLILKRKIDNNNLI